LKAVDKAIANSIPPGTVLETTRGPIASEMKDHHVARGDGLLTSYPIPLSSEIEPQRVVGKPLKRSEDPRYNKVIPVTTLVDYRPAPVSEEEKRQHVERNIKSLVGTSHTLVDLPKPVGKKPEDIVSEPVEQKVQGYSNPDAKLTSYKDIHDTPVATKHGVNFGLTSTDERIINRMFEERQRYPKFSDNELAQKMGLSVALVKSALRKIRNTADARAKVVC
jgi:ribosomal protein S25